MFLAFIRGTYTGHNKLIGQVNSQLDYLTAYTDIIADLRNIGSE